MKTSYNFLFLASLIILGSLACTPAPKSEKEKEPELIVVKEKPLYQISADQKVYISNLEEGSEISSPVTIQMGVEGMEVEPAGEVSEGKGHHHIIIDGSFIPMGQVVPADAHNIHYGDGRTETELELTPGPHTLTLQFADGFHRFSCRGED